MTIPRALLLAAAIVLLAGTTAQARISHGYSGILTIDTATAVNDDANALPQVTILAAIYPNPFNPRTMIEFELAEAGTIELAICDVGGRTYFCRLNFSQGSQTRKLTLAR